MNILIESSNANRNWGDASMLHAAIRRLNGLVPAVSITLMNEQSSQVAEQYPNVRPLPYGLRQAWHHQRPLWKLLDQKAPGVVDRMSTTWPGLKNVLTQSKLTMLTRDPQPWRQFLTYMDNADALLVSGGGFVTDVFSRRAEKVLNLIMLAHSRNVPVFMFSQGIGPLRSRRLRQKARRALQNVRFVAVREKRCSYPLLRSLGVDEHRITATGDDSVDLAFSARPEKLGTGIGANLRIASYSNLSDESVPAIGYILAQISENLSAPLLPVPIAHKGDDSDVESIRQMLEAAGKHSEATSALKTVDDVIRRVGKCRVVVTGSYHGAVFALSQGIPVIGISSSRYYDIKFNGLADMFGEGLTLLHPETNNFETELRTAIEETWSRAPSIRASLLESAQHQAEASREAYNHMTKML